MPPRHLSRAAYFAALPVYAARTPKPEPAGLCPICWHRWGRAGYPRADGTCRACVPVTTSPLPPPDLDFADGPAAPEFFEL